MLPLGYRPSMSIYQMVDRSRYGCLTCQWMALLLFCFCFPVFTQAAQLKITPQAPAEVHQLKAGQPRTLAGDPIVGGPSFLMGQKAVVMPRGKMAEPGSEFSFKVNEPVTVFLAVESQGHARLPDTWKKTDFVLQTENGKPQSVYQQSFEAGEVSIPPHGGRIGRVFGTPHLAIVRAGDWPLVRLNVETPRKSRVFLDNEDVSVQINPTGLTDKATLAFTLSEQDGDYQKKGEINLSAGKPASLPLELPQRGLYDLKLTLTKGEYVIDKQVQLAKLFEPNPSSKTSPWGIFWIGTGRGNTPVEVAESFRNLGGSWTRVSFWDWGKVTINNEKVECNWGVYPGVIRAFHEKEIHVMGSLQMIPRELSSKAEGTTHSGDAGALAGRVPPADYKMWDQFIFDLATEFKKEVPVWEVGNEPNTPGHYWAGTRDEFVEFARHTIAALRRGNPETKIAMAGFTLERSAYTFYRHMLDAGLGKEMDILSVHSLYNKPVSVEKMQELSAKAGFDFPVWNTEPKHIIPMKNFAAGIKVNMHFLHMHPPHGALDKFEALVHSDLTPTRFGVAYSVAAKVIGEGKYIPSEKEIEGVEYGIFQHPASMCAVFHNIRKGTVGGSATLQVEPKNGQGVEVLDSFGRVLPQQIKNGKLTLALEGIRFIRGAKQLRLLEATAPHEEADPDEILVSMVKAKPVGWVPKEEMGWPGGTYLSYYGDDAPPVMELAFEVPEDGNYDLFISCSSTERFTPPWTISPFAWKLDKGEFQKVSHRLPAIWRTSGAHHVKGAVLKSKEYRDTYGRDILQKLGTFKLDQGQHTLAFKLLAPRQKPDKKYSIHASAFVLRPAVASVAKAGETKE